MPRSNNSDDRNLRVRGPATYFRIKLEGANGPIEINQSLGRIDPPTARRVRDALVSTLEGAALCQAMGLPVPENDLAKRFGVEAMLERLGSIRKKPSLATIGEIIAAFTADCAGRNINTETGSSGYKAISALRLVIKTVHGIETNTDVDALSSNVLKPELLQDFQAKRTAAAVAEGPEAVQTARITAASTINQARMVIAAPAMKEECMRSLTLPDLEEFRAWKPAVTTRKLRVPVDDVTLERLRVEVDGLWFKADAGDAEARARWLAVVLAGNMGLRRGSAVMARWSWIRQLGGKQRIYIVATDEAEPKGNEYSVEIEDTVWKDMCALRQAGSDYIVPGAGLEARLAVFQANAEWLRGLGLNVDKPNHELRAVFLQAMDRKHGRQAAVDAAGHDKARTTEIYTGRGRSGASVRAL